MFNPKYYVCKYSKTRQIDEVVKIYASMCILDKEIQLQLWLPS